MKKILCALIALTICISVFAGISPAYPTYAVAEVYGKVTTTGQVNLRTGPGLGYDIISSVGTGAVLDYQGELSTDNRGVDWYRVDYKGNTEAWISSKYSEIEIYQNVPEPEPAPEPAPETDGSDIYTAITNPSGVMSLDQIRQWYGVFNLNELVNTTGFEITPSGETQIAKVYFAPEVYMGGSEGYWDDWCASDGIIAEKFADLDGDGADELLIAYVDCRLMTDYGYDQIIDFRYIAIFEPVDGGYEFADYFGIDNHSNCEYIIKLTNGERGTFIAVCYVAYGDGGTGIIGYDIYNYGGYFVDAVSIGSITNYGSYHLDTNISPMDVFAYTTMCNEYAGYTEETRTARIFEGENFHRTDANWDLNPNNDDGSICHENLADFVDFAPYSQPYGLEIGYNVTQYDGYEWYDLYINGGTDLVYACEGWEGDRSFIELRMNSTLDHTADYVPGYVATVVPEGWGSAEINIMSAGNTNRDAGAELTWDMFNKVIHVEDAAGGWFKLVAPVDGDYIFNVYSPALTVNSFSMEVQTSSGAYHKLIFNKSNDIQTGIVPGIKQGETIYWWDCDDSGNYWTLQDPFMMMISVQAAEIPAAETPEEPAQEPSEEPEVSGNVTGFGMLPTPVAPVGNVAFDGYADFSVSDFDLAAQNSSLNISWNADNATEYQLKAILIAEEPNATADQSSGALAVFADTTTTETSISIPTDQLAAGQYVKIAVCAYGEDGTQSANWPWIGFHIIDSSQVIAPDTLVVNESAPLNENGRMTSVNKTVLNTPHYYMIAGTAPADPAILEDIILQFDVNANYKPDTSTYCNYFAANVARASGAFIPGPGDQICQNCYNIISIANDYSGWNEYIDGNELRCSCDNPLAVSVAFSVLNKSSWDQVGKGKSSNGAYYGDLTRWFIEKSHLFGWEVINAETANNYPTMTDSSDKLDSAVLSAAQDYANQGYLVIGVRSDWIASKTSGVSGHAFIIHPHEDANGTLYTTQAGGVYNSNGTVLYVNRENAPDGGATRSSANHWNIYYVFKGIQ